MPDFLKYWQTQKHPYQVWRLGQLTDQQKRDFYAGIDLFALPSLTDSFGLVLLEAWANGVPNVAYRAGGIADLIRTGQDGLLTPAGNIDALAAALRQVIIDATLRQRLGAAGQKRVSIEFRWEDKLALVRETYLRATNRGRKSEVRDQKSKPVDFEPLKAWLEAQTL
jgi:glycosyltransferase involved in cell wall biosynthesis